MRRLLIGLGSFVFVLITVVLLAPFFLPKEEIKRQVVAELDKRLGWQLRLDGPVSLSMFPSFGLIAEDIGISGEAGADGIEFAKAERMEFGLAWGGLFSGDVNITGFALEKPDIYLEVNSNGSTSWEPRRDFNPPAEAVNQPQTRQIDTTAQSDSAAQINPANTQGASESYLKSIGIDQLTISDGRVTYRDGSTAAPLELTNLDLVISAPDLSGDIELTSNFRFQDTPFDVNGTLSDAIGLAGGNITPLQVAISSGENSASMEGTAGIEPTRFDIAMNAEGPSLGALAELAGRSLPVDPGAYAVKTRVAGDEASISIADLTMALGELALDGAADIDLAGLLPEISGRLVLRNGSVEDLLQLAGQNLPASGTLAADLAFETVGLTGAEIISGLDINGKISLSDGEISGLNLASSFGGDPAADKLSNLSVDVDLKGLESPVSLAGALTWRGEGFSVTGEGDTARLLAGNPAPVAVALKGSKVSAGFEGQVSPAGSVDGAVNVETADLRGLAAWLGQPIGAGGGLKTFKASGIFGLQNETITFEETRFTLDDTSGEANGQIGFGGKPSVTAALNLRELVLDPYLGTGPATASGGQTASTQSSGNQSSGSAQGGGTGWSTEPIDFSGLQAVNADLKVNTEQIRWDKIVIDKSALTATIQNGVLKANLDTLSLYNGSGMGTLELNGASATPDVSAKFSLSGLDAYPLLRDAAGFEWIEGDAAISLDVTTKGASEQALVQGLNGSADYEFTDGAIRGINIPKMVRGLSIETLLGWQENPSEKTDFSALSASFRIDNGVATTDNLSMSGPLLRMTGSGTTDMPQQTLSWRVDPKIVASLEGQAPRPPKKGEGKSLAGLGVPVVVKGPWADPRIYPDIAGILENPEAAYKQLQQTGGELISILKGDTTPSDGLVDTANQVIEQATGGRTQIDVQKVIEGDVNDEDVLKAVEEGFGLPSGLLGNVFGGQKKEN